MTPAPPPMSNYPAYPQNFTPIPSAGPANSRVTQSSQPSFDF